MIVYRYLTSQNKVYSFLLIIRIFTNSALKCFHCCVCVCRVTRPAVLLGRMGRRERGEEETVGPNRMLRSTWKMIVFLCGTGEAKTSRLMRQR